jgi:hypothetical protein
MRPTSRSAGTLFLVVADDDFTVFKGGKGFLGGEGLGTRYGQSSEGGWFFEHDWQGPPRYVQVRGWFFGEELVRYCFLLSLSKISRSLCGLEFDLLVFEISVGQWFFLTLFLPGSVSEPGNK